MRVRILIILVVSLALGVAAVLRIMSRQDRQELPARPGVRQLSWDLSRQWDVGQVSWPASIAGDLWLIDGPTQLDLLRPDGRRLSYRLDSLSLRRTEGMLAEVSLGFPNQTLDEARETARRVGEEWDLHDPMGLDEWHRRRKADGGNTAEGRAYSRIRNTLWPTRSLEVRPTYQEREPWFVSLTIGFEEWTEEQRRTIGLPPRSMPSR